MPQLQLSPVKAGRKDSVVWGNDSFSQLRLNFSLSSMQDTESTAVVLIREIEDSIEQQGNRKFFIEKIIERSVMLAKARYESGSVLGAILSMRKIHKHKSTKAYIAAACFQLTTLRDMVQITIDRRSMFDADVTSQRNMMYGILQDLKEAKCPIPSNEELLMELQAMLEEDDIS